jgi:hypothetical protein
MNKSEISEAQIIVGMRDVFLADSTRRIASLHKNRNAVCSSPSAIKPFEAFRADVYTLKGMG